jgi:hypothetical protein
LQQYADADVPMRTAEFGDAVIVALARADRPGR